MLVGAIGNRRGVATRRAWARAGFTLVEMLVVIAIIGMLMALVSVAVWKALERAKITKIIVEIGQLQTAIQSYKEKHLQYPPCMAEINVVNRKVHFMRHVQVAFTNANYGTASGNYDNLRNNLMSGTGLTSQPYNYKDSTGDIKTLDLNSLDQAEARTASDRPTSDRTRNGHRRVALRLGEPTPPQGDRAARASSHRGPWRPHPAICPSGHHDRASARSSRPVVPRSAPTGYP